MSAGAPESTGLATPAAAPSGSGLPTSGPTSGFPRIEKYELLEEIGHGGMATVYRARDPRLGREVAVKVIHKHLRENPEVGTRFVAEARAAAKLRHPGIVDVYDVSAEEDLERYLVVELIRGTTLRKVLQAHRDMPAEIGAAMVLEVTDAVEHAHEGSIIHRDIKPENVLVELPEDRLRVEAPPVPTPRPSGTRAAGEPTTEAEVPRPVASSASSPSDTQRSLEDALTPHPPRTAPKAEVKTPIPPPARPRDERVIIKITDFGIAKLLDAQGVTSTGQVLGSPAHMAPEQIEGGEVDARTDVFALGVLMYECLVGHLPFEGKNPAQVLRRVLEGSYPPADRERPSVGGRWGRILAKALAHDPADRLASAAALGAAIRAELEALGMSEPRAEISAYFADPRAYSAALVDRLVPKLVARGEAARKVGDVPGAAADWNRALALRPDDLTILKRMAALTSSAGRKRLARRVGVIVGASAVLGLVAFQVARVWKASAAGRDLRASSSAAVVDAPRLPPTPTGDRPATPPDLSATALHASPSAEASAKRVRVAANPSFTLAAPPPVATVRKVKFNVVPKGAKVSVDGSPVPKWWSTTLDLRTGQHHVEVTPQVDDCCNKISTNIVVEPAPADKPESVFEVGLTMEIRPAKVSLANGPQNGQMFCKGLQLNLFSGSTQQVKLREPDWAQSCDFSAPDKPTVKRGVKLFAGKENVVNWPAD